MIIMNKKNSKTILFVCAVTILSLVTLSKPSISSGWSIVFFFIALFGLIFYGSVVIGGFVGIGEKRIKRIALLIACIIIAGQILVTFQALRPIELILISSVFCLIGWYASRARV